MHKFEGCVRVFCISPGILFCEINFLQNCKIGFVYMYGHVCMCC